jgi:1-acyl-sn-glycerol-3-phosphate acyltransferase
MVELSAWKAILKSWQRHPLVEEKLKHVNVQLSDAGQDVFGLDLDAIRNIGGLFSFLYFFYFRCQVFHIKNLPQKRVILVANHAGALPFDGAMIASSVFFEADPPRIVRSMVERFASEVPFLAPLLSRCGQVLGTPKNCKRLLENEQTILIFPEGARGLAKPYHQAYQLQRFGHGFMRLSMETKAPIVPVAVIGSEEQAPTLRNLSQLANLFGWPAFPITAAPLNGLIPWPVRYRIYFGAPMVFDGDYHNSHHVQHNVTLVRKSLRELLSAGLQQRKHIFF